MLSTAQAVPIIQRQQAEIADLRHRLGMHQHFAESHPHSCLVQVTPDPWSKNDSPFQVIPVGESLGVYQVDEPRGLHCYLAISVEDAMARHALHRLALHVPRHGQEAGVFGPFEVRRLADEEVLAAIPNPSVPGCPEWALPCAEWIHLALEGGVQVNRFGLLAATMPVGLGSALSEVSA